MRGGLMKRPYELIFDHEGCWGCKTCEVACKQENHASEGVKLIEIIEKGPSLEEGEGSFEFYISLCRHCEDPACLQVCPEGAISMREDGTVLLEEESCSGCGLCMEACPYDAISFDMTKGVACKCNLCFHRVDRGLLPACADNICPGHCIYFGDADEIKREIEERHKRWASGG